jgi:lysophospholipase L1-like esterase
MKRILTAVRKLWVAFGVVVLVLVAVETVPDTWKSFWRGVKYEGGQKPDYRTAAEALHNQDWAAPYFREAHSRLRVEWAPYVQWRHPPLAGVYLKFDANGFRNTWTDPAPPESGAPLRIFMFGSSTMVGVGARDDYTIPSVLAKRLAAVPYNVEVTNFGVVGHVSTQELIFLIEELKSGNVPDLVIFYDGVSDIIAAEQTGRAGTPQNEAGRAREFNLLKRDRQDDLTREALLVALQRTMGRAQDFANWLGLGEDDPPADAAAPDPAPLAQSVIERYAENIRIVRLLADEYGFEALFFWQPNVFTKNVLTAHEQRYRNTHALEPLYVATYQARRGNAALGAIPGAIDISDVFRESGENYFLDFAHTTESGNEKIADAMLPGVRAAFQRLTE